MNERQIFSKALAVCDGCFVNFLVWYSNITTVLKTTLFDKSSFAPFIYEEDSFNSSMKLASVLFKPINMDIFIFAYETIMTTWWWRSLGCHSSQVLKVLVSFLSNCTLQYPRKSLWGIVIPLLGQTYREIQLRSIQSCKGEISDICQNVENSSKAFRYEHSFGRKLFIRQWRLTSFVYSQTSCWAWQYDK